MDESMWIALVLVAWIMFLVAIVWLSLRDKTTP